MKNKVYSCSQFFNELDLLELKLETLNDVVDYFVISESTYTHSGKPKNLFYNENKERFKKFHHKIIHQIVTDTPSVYLNLMPKKDKDPFYNLVVERVNKGDWWNHAVESYGRDTFEKESLIRPLANLKLDKNDIILLSDTDEIVNPKKLLSVLNTFDNNKTYHFQHDMFYYYMNLQKDEPWYGTIAISYNRFLNKSFCEMRTHKEGEFIPAAGWHFTFQNGEDTIRKKIESYGEQSLNQEYIKNQIAFNVKNAIELKRDLFGRQCVFTLRDINDGTFPDYLVKHQTDIYLNNILRK